MMIEEVEMVLLVVVVAGVRERKIADSRRMHSYTNWEARKGAKGGGCTLTRCVITRRQMNFRGGVTVGLEGRQAGAQQFAATRTEGKREAARM